MAGANKGDSGASGAKNPRFERRVDRSLAASNRAEQNERILAELKANSTKVYELATAGKVPEKPYAQLNYASWEAQAHAALKQDTFAPYFLIMACLRIIVEAMSKPFIHPSMYSLKWETAESFFLRFKRDQRVKPLVVADKLIEMAKPTPSCVKYNDVCNKMIRQVTEKARNYFRFGDSLNVGKMSMVIVNGDDIVMAANVEFNAIRRIANEKVSGLVAYVLQTFAKVLYVPSTQKDVKGPGNWLSLRSTYDESKGVWETKPDAEGAERLVCNSNNASISGPEKPGFHVDITQKPVADWAKASVYEN